MKVFVVLSAVLAIAVAAPGVNSINDESASFRKMIANCLSSEDAITCFSVKGITAMNRAARSANIEILPGVSFQRLELFLVIIKLLVCIQRNEL